MGRRRGVKVEKGKILKLNLDLIACSMVSKFVAKANNNDLITQIRLGGRGRGEISKERYGKKERIRRNKVKRGKDKIRKRRKGEKMK